MNQLVFVLKYVARILNLAEISAKRFAEKVALLVHI